MFGQIIQNGPLKKNGVGTLANLFFRKIKVSFKTSYKELIYCINYPNIHIHTFHKRLNFI